MSMMLGENSAVANVPVVVELEEHLRANFFVYRLLMKKELIENGPATQPEEYLAEIDQKFRQYWHELFHGPIRSGMGKENDFTEAAAGRYTDELADQVNSVSNRAFIEGYNAALNKGVDKAVAWQRIADAWGLDPAQMRAWVTSYPEGGYQTEEVPNEDRLNKMLDTRARRIAGHEAWTVHQLGKQVQWLADDAFKNGIKVWRTAHDELVCPTCAPMDGIAIKVGSRFKTAMGSFFSPPIHINCRCDVILQTENDVTKSMGDDPYDRDRRGRFAHQEQRVNRPVVRQLEWPDADYEEMPYDLPRQKPSPFLKEKKKKRHSDASDSRGPRVPPSGNDATDTVLAPGSFLQEILGDKHISSLKEDDVIGASNLSIFPNDVSNRSMMVDDDPSGSYEDTIVRVINAPEGDSLTGHLRVVSIEELNPSEVDGWIDNDTYLDTTRVGDRIESGAQEVGFTSLMSGQSIRMITLEYER